MRLYSYFACTEVLKMSRIKQLEIKISVVLMVNLGMLDALTSVGHYLILTGMAKIPIIWVFVHVSEIMCPLPFRCLGSASNLFV